MNNPNMFPMQPMAQQMAQQGRYGDSMMVHMNPIEVAGIASLSPTGQLTTNPMTGQPEAFLPFLAPLLGSVFGGTITAGLGSILPGALGTAVGGLASNAAAASAIGSGLATTAVTGDLKEGLLSGLTGFGVGKALGAASQALNPAVEAAQTAVTEGTKTAASLGDALTKQETLLAGLTEGSPEALKATETISNLQGSLDDVVRPRTLAGPLQPGASRPQIGSLSQSQADLSSAIADSNRNVFGAIKDSPGKFAAEAGKGLLNPMSAVPIAVGEGQRAAMAAQDERDRMFGKRAADREQDLQDSQSIVDASIRQVGSDYGIDYSQEYGRDYDTRYAAQGGITSVNPTDFQRRYAELQMMGRQPIQMERGGSSSGNYNFPNVGVTSSFGAPAGRQARLRGPEVVRPEELVGTRPGFQPEINYFRQKIEAAPKDGSDAATDAATDAAVDPASSFDFSNIDPAFLQGIGAVGKGGSMGGMSLPANVQAAEDILNRKSVSTRRRNAARKIVDQYEEEGRGGQDYFDEVIAQTYGSGYGMQEGGDTTGQMDQSAAMQLIEQVSMALLGRLPEDQAEVVINRFIDEFGSEAFQMLRSQVLESVVPNSQKEGVIQGEGKGMDDQVPGMIGDQQPVAVSPGEFIVPADVVSGIGDGDTNSGVQELEGMMDRVRQDRTGTMQQPAPLGAKAGGALPA
tara:strand:+ start:3147 stop:5207 length:2061 start_codon:yes stop_codon:yes gene_type:complete